MKNNQAQTLLQFNPLQRLFMTKRKQSQCEAEGYRKGFDEGRAMAEASLEESRRKLEQLKTEWQLRLDIVNTVVAEPGKHLVSLKCQVARYTLTDAVAVQHIAKNILLSITALLEKEIAREDKREEKLKVKQGCGCGHKH